LTDTTLPSDSHNTTQDNLNHTLLTESAAAEKLSLPSARPISNQHFGVIIPHKHPKIVLAKTIAIENDDISIDSVEESIGDKYSPELSISNLLSPSIPIKEAVSNLLGVKGFTDDHMKSFVKLMDSRHSESDKKYLIEYILDRGRSLAVLDMFAENKGIVVLRRWLEDSRDGSILVPSILRFIKLLPMDISRLQESKIGRILKNLSKGNSSDNESLFKYNNIAIRKVSKEIMESWKLIILNADKETPVLVSVSGTNKRQLPDLSKVDLSTKKPKTTKPSLPIKKVSDIAPNDFFKAISAPLSKIKKVSIETMKKNSVASTVSTLSTVSTSEPVDLNGNVTRESPVMITDIGSPLLQKIELCSIDIDPSTSPVINSYCFVKHRLENDIIIVENDLLMSPLAPVPSYRSIVIESPDNFASDIKMTGKKRVHWAPAFELETVRYLPPLEDYEKVLFIVNVSER
jgi:hypothetical protein